MTGKLLSVDRLREYVSAAREEFALASAFHEAWRPSAYDNTLHRRLDNSFSAHTFNAIRLALRREMMLSLMRMWDSRRDNLNLESVSATLRKRETVDTLVAGINAPSYLHEQTRIEFSRTASDTTTLIDAYSRGGCLFHVRESMKALRDEILAHRNMAPGRIFDSSTGDDEIEKFYHDNATIVKNLMHVVHLTAYDPLEVADVYRHYASFFWAGIKSEQVEGHPRFRGARKVTEQ